MDLHDLPLFAVDSAIFLGVVVVFFGAVSFYSRLVRKTAAPPSAHGTIRLALLGFVLLVTDSIFGAKTAYHPVLQGVGHLVVLLCLANLIIYLIIDVYVHYRTRSEVPSFVRDLVTLIVYLLAAIVSLRVVFHIDISSIVTTTTVLTATIAFAMQNTLTNVLSGFSIQSDNNLRKNTWIAIKDKDVVGKIVNVGFRYTSLKTFDNSILMVPNNLIMQNVVTSLGSERENDLAATMLDISIGYELPPEKAKNILLSVFAGEPEICTDPPPQVRVQRFAESSIDYRLRYTLREYGTRDQVKDRLYGKIWYAFTREGYGFPYPHHEIITVTEQRPPFSVKQEGIREELKRIEFFCILTEQEQRYLAENAKLKVFGPGELVVQEGDEGNSLFVVLRGELSVSQEQRLIGSLQGCDFFGEMSLLTGALRQATVEAKGEVWLLEVSKDVLEPLIRDNPAIMDTLSTVLATREELNIERRRHHDRGTETVTKKEEYLKLLRRFFGF